MRNRSLIKKYFWIFPLLIASFALVLWIISWGVQVTNNYVNLQNGKEKFEASLEISKAIVGGVGTLATIVGGVVLFLNFRVANQNLKLAERKAQLDAEKSKKDIEIAESRLATDRFSKAVEQLITSNNITVVLSGIYTLSTIARDSPEYHWLVMKVLASFIRIRLPDYSSNPIKVHVDMQEAVTAITQRNYTYDVSGETLDLSGSLFVQANLVNANFRGCNLKTANFGNTNLEGVDFSGVNLEGAIFYGADLSNAILKDAKLKGAKYCSETKFPDNFEPDIAGMEEQ
jgi:hypothetical protein